MFLLSNKLFGFDLHYRVVILCD